MFTPTSVEQRVRIAVTLLSARHMGREVTRDQLIEHLDDLSADEIDLAVGRLQAEGVVFAAERGLVPRPPPSPYGIMAARPAP